MKEEGGITQHSLINAEELIAKHGKPYRLHFCASKDKADNAVLATFKDGFSFAFTGFAWNYNGEGPRGLDTFLNMCDADITRQILERQTGDGDTAYTHFIARNDDLD